jgi:hypothetical protein
MACSKLAGDVAEAAGAGTGAERVFGINIW